MNFIYYLLHLSLFTLNGSFNQNKSRTPQTNRSLQLVQQKPTLYIPPSSMKSNLLTKLHVEDGTTSGLQEARASEWVACRRWYGMVVRSRESSETGITKRICWVHREGLLLLWEGRLKRTKRIGLLLS